MLSYRTHILLDDTMREVLRHLAKAQKTTVGKLVRQAIVKTYLTPDPYAKRKAAVTNLRKLRVPVSAEPIDYKDLITYGRK